MLWGALAFAAGIASSWRWWRPASWWAVAVVVFAAGALVLGRKHRYAAFGLALLTMGALGSLCFTGRTQAAADDLRPAALDRFADGREVVLTGTLRKDGVVWHAGQEFRQAMEVALESIQDNGATIPIRSGVRVNLYWREDGPVPENAALKAALRYGQRLRFPARLRVARNFGNPGAWDYRGYLAGRGIMALASVRRDRVELLDATPGEPPERWRNLLRRRLIERVNVLWTGEQAALISTMLIGERSYLDRDLRVQFQRSGTYHLLVISGLHIGILAFTLLWVLRRMRVGEAFATLLTVLLLAAYAYLADAGEPVVRATLMLAIGLGARLLYRERAVLNSLGLAALILLAADPRALFDASFQLTFLSVLAIAAIAVPLLQRTSLPLRRSLRYLDSTSYDMLLTPRWAQFRLDLRLLRERLASLLGPRLAQWGLLCAGHGLIALYETAVISGVVQLGLALPMALYFHRATVRALPANMLAVPLMEVLMPAAIAAVGTSYLWIGAAKPLAQIASWTLSAITGSVGLLAGSATHDVRVASPGYLGLAVAVAGFVLAAAAVRRRPAFALAGLAALAVSAAWLVLVPPAARLRPGVLEVTAIDVGQADSLLVVAPEGRKLLVDAAGPIGPGVSQFDFGEDVISPYLWSRGITRLDAVALTHPHSDHIGGMASVLANFRPRELWLAPSAETRALEQLLQLASALGTRVMYRAGGESFRFGRAEIDVLAPPAERSPSPKVRNDDSLVMRIAYGRTAALLEADAERRTERLMLAGHPSADLLKVAHNGSATSSTDEFLRAVRPRWAVISVGFRNQFRHPRPEVLHRLAKIGAVTYRTDMMGAITFYLDGSRTYPASTGTN